MKPIVVFSVLIRLDGGGAERSAARLVEPLAGKGVTLNRYAIDPLWSGEESAGGTTLLPDSRRGVKRLLTAAVNLAAAVRRGSPDVVHLNCEAPEIVGLITKALTLNQRYGLVITNHHMKAWHGLRAPLGTVVRVIYKAFGAVYVNCYKDDGQGGKVPVIYNPTGVLLPLKPDLKKHRRLVVIGRLIDRKRVDDILMAAGAAGWRDEVIIVGAGPEAIRLQALAIDLGLNATFLGHRKDPWEVVQENDIFVTASSSEGEPLTLIEALQRDLPVLASEIPAHLRVLGRHPGLFGSTSELALRFTEVLQDSKISESLKLPGPARSALLMERDPELIASQWTALYRTLARSS